MGGLNENPHGNCLGQGLALSRSEQLSLPPPTFVPLLLVPVLTKGFCTWSEKQMVREGVEPGEGGLAGGLFLAHEARYPGEVLWGSMIRRAGYS